MSAARAPTYSGGMVAVPSSSGSPATPASTAPASSPDERVSATLVMAGAAVAAALVAMFGERGAFSPLTVAAALAGLVPWALVAGGVRLPPAAFAAMGLAPALVATVVDRNPGGIFPAMLVVVWVTRTSDSRRVVAATVAVAAAGVVALAVREGTAHETGLVYFLGGVGISWLAGMMLRRQERLTNELRELHDLAVEHAAASERTRVAREVHDVVAHSLTVVMLHLTGARRVLRADPARADEALERAEEIGRDSLDSIRHVVGLLRSPDAAGVDGPLPGVADLPALVAGFRAGGTPVELRVEIDAIEVDPATALAVYRVVQESLTNAMRHAPGASCSVAVTEHDERRFRVTVVNGAPTARAVDDRAVERDRHGVRGMTERVRALGGDLESGPTADGGWSVVATLPVRRRRASERTVDRREDEWTSPTAGR